MPDLGLGGLGGGIGGLIGQQMAGPGGMPQFQEIVNLMRKLKDPTFDMRSLSPPEQQLLGQMIPQMYNADNPQAAALAQEIPGIRESQLSSLGTLSDIRDQGLPLQDRIAAQSAQNAILQAQQQGNLAIQSNLAQRGRLGAGDELQARLIGNQGLTNSASMMGNNLMAQALDRRMGAAQAAGGMAGNIRSQDFARAGYNADAINRFNALVSGQNTAAAQYNAGARERAQGYNIGTAQDIGNTNVMNQYQTALANLTRQNSLRQLASQSERERMNMLAGSLRGLGSAREQRRADTIANYQSLGQGLGGALGGGLGGGGGGLLGGLL